jgi:hypothetical protein
MSETKKKWPRYRGYSRLMKSGNSGGLSVPSDMMSVLTEGLLFKPELTKDGILFRITDESKMTPDDKPVPAWVKTKVKAAPKAEKAESEHSGPIPPVDDEHPDNDLSDEGEVIADDDDAPTEDVEAADSEGDDEPPTDNDSPF